MNIPVDRVGWHRGVIGLRAGGPGATLPLGRLTYCGNWLILLPPPLLLVCFPLMSVCHYLVYFSFILAGSFALVSERVKLKVCGIKKFATAPLNIPDAPHGKSWCNAGNVAGEKMMSEGNVSVLGHSNSTWELSLGTESCRLAFIKPLKYGLTVSFTLTCCWPSAPVLSLL